MNQHHCLYFCLKPSGAVNKQIRPSSQVSRTNVMFDFPFVRFPPTNSTTGRPTGGNAAISCGKDPLCAAPRWANVIRPAGVRSSPPPIKDTVIVPARGYTVVRLRTDNPGYWLMHCHMELHAQEGMAIVFNVAPELHPAKPPGFPLCGDFNWTVAEFESYIGDRMLSRSSTTGTTVHGVIGIPSTTANGKMD